MHSKLCDLISITQRARLGDCIPTIGGRNVNFTFKETPQCTGIRGKLCGTQCEQLPPVLPQVSDAVSDAVPPQPQAAQQDIAWVLVMVIRDFKKRVLDCDCRQKYVATTSFCH